MLKKVRVCNSKTKRVYMLKNLRKIQKITVILAVLLWLKSVEIGSLILKLIKLTVRLMPQSASLINTLSKSPLSPPAQKPKIPIFLSLSQKPKILSLFQPQTLTLTKLRRNIPPFFSRDLDASFKSRRCWLIVPSSACQDLRQERSKVKRYKWEPIRDDP